MTQIIIDLVNTPSVTSVELSGMLVALALIVVYGGVLGAALMMAVDSFLGFYTAPIPQVEYTDWHLGIPEVGPPVVTEEPEPIIEETWVDDITLPCELMCENGEFYYGEWEVDLPAPYWEVGTMPPVMEGMPEWKTPDLLVTVAKRRKLRRQQLVEDNRRIMAEIMGWADTHYVEYEY